MYCKKFILFAILFVAGAHGSFAQDTLLVSGISAPDGTAIRWYPMQAAVWKKALNFGYFVERYDVVNGTPVAASRFSPGGAGAVLPKDTTWFNQHRNDEEGLMEAVGQLLWDTTFQFKDKSVMDADAVRYNYLVAEAQRRPAVAQALGLLVWDTLSSRPVAGKTYRYVIKSANPGAPFLLGQIDLAGGSGREVDNPADKPLIFTFPDDVSLTDMANVGKDRTVAQVLAMGKSYGDSIVLRWAPNTAALWRATRIDGYTLERVDQDGNQKTLAKVMPWTQEQLSAATALLQKDSLALLAASNLYGDDASAQAAGLADKAALYENKFTFSLFAAEGSPLAAEILGLRFTDKEVQRGVEYVYYIKTPGAVGLQSGSVRIKNDGRTDDKPAEFTATAGDHALVLTWNKSINSRRFSGYKLERSEDKGRTWAPITKNLLVFPEDEQQQLSIFMFVDSVAENYKEYRYRLSGLTSFGDFSAWTEVKGEAIDLTPPLAPILQQAVFNDTFQTATVRWITDVIAPDFGAYLVLMGKDVDGAFDTISGPLKENVFRFVYKPKGGFSGDEPHYFRVIARDKKGNYSTSLPVYMHVPDLVPPAPPAKMEGYILENGTVKVVWQPGSEKDLTGYWLYFANDTTNEFTQVNPQLLRENTYTYRIDPKSLNPYIYYVVIAEDKSNNRSRESRILTLRRPDKVPPVTPQLFAPNAGAGAIGLAWKPSPSTDATKYFVFRRQVDAADTTWILIHTSTSRVDTAFADNDVVMDQLYDYKILAEDASGNQSEFTIPHPIRTVFNPTAVTVTEFTAALGTENGTSQLQWTFAANKNALPPGQTYAFHVYRSTGGGVPVYLATVASEQFQFTDKELISNVLYNYSVRVHFSNGQEGTLCPAKSVMMGSAGGTSPAPGKKGKKPGKG